MAGDDGVGGGHFPESVSLPPANPTGDAPWLPADVRRLLERLPAGAYLCDPAGLITYYNRRAAELWGREPALNAAADRFCGSFRLFSVDGVPLRHEECWMALALRTQTDYFGREIVIERPNGQRRTVLAYASPLWDERDELLGAINVLMDITDRKHVEERQRQLETTLAHMGRLRLAGEMAASFAHEVNQPLTAIGNYCETCLRLLRAGRADTDELAATLTEIMGQASHAGDIIRSLRAFTRKTPLQPVDADVDVLIRDAIGLVAIDARQHHVSLRREGDELLPSVRVDPAQIQQVLVNLMRNGIEAMADVADDRPRTITVRATPAEQAVMITVRDTGTGLSAAVREQLFHPFVTTRADGVGLGLAISKTIIEAHGGRLWAEPEPPTGAIFHFTVPVAETAHSASESNASKRTRS